MSNSYMTCWGKKVSACATKEKVYASGAHTHVSVELVCMFAAQQSKEYTWLTSIQDTIKSGQWPGSGIPKVRCLRAGRKLLGAVRLCAALVMNEVWC